MQHKQNFSLSIFLNNSFSVSRLNSKTTQTFHAHNRCSTTERTNRREFAVDFQEKQQLILTRLM